MEIDPTADRNELDPDATPSEYATGPLVREGVPTGDGRMIAVGALTYRDSFPLPLQYTPATTEGHLSAVNVGSIVAIAPVEGDGFVDHIGDCLLYTSPSPRDRTRSRMPSSA